MSHPVRPTTQIEPKRGHGTTHGAETGESTPAVPSSSGAQYTHPDPEREKALTAILTNAWPKIKASMFYLRDR